MSQPPVPKAPKLIPLTFHQRQLVGGGRVYRLPIPSTQGEAVWVALPQDESLKPRTSDGPLSLEDARAWASNQSGAWAEEGPDGIRIHGADAVYPLSDGRRVLCFGVTTAPAWLDILEGGADPGTLDRMLGAVGTSIEYWTPTESSGGAILAAGQRCLDRFFALGRWVVTLMMLTSLTLVLSLLALVLLISGKVPNLFGSRDPLLADACMPLITEADAYTQTSKLCSALVNRGEQILDQATWTDYHRVMLDVATDLTRDESAVNSRQAAEAVRAIHGRVLLTMLDPSIVADDGQSVRRRWSSENLFASWSAPDGWNREGYGEQLGDTDVFQDIADSPEAKGLKVAILVAEALEPGWSSHYELVYALRRSENEKVDTKVAASKPPPSKTTFIVKSKEGGEALDVFRVLSEDGSECCVATPKAQCTTSKPGPYRIEAPGFVNERVAGGSPTPGIELTPDSRAPFRLRGDQLLLTNPLTYKLDQADPIQGYGFVDAIVSFMDEYSVQSLRITVAVDSTEHVATIRAKKLREKFNSDRVDGSAGAPGASRDGLVKWTVYFDRPPQKTDLDADNSQRAKGEEAKKAAAAAKRAEQEAAAKKEAED